MSVSIVAFVGDAGALDDALLAEVSAQVGEAVPAVRLDVCTLERLEFRFLFEADASPRLAERGTDPRWAALVVAECNGLDTASIGDLARRLHARLRADGTATIEMTDHYRGTRRIEDWAYTVAIQQRKVDIDRESFISYYNDVYVPNVTAALVHPPFETYRIGVVRAVIGEFPYDGITFNEYASEAALRAHIAQQVIEVSSRTDPSDFVHVVEKYSGRRLQSAAGAGGRCRHPQQ